MHKSFGKMMLVVLFTVCISACASVKPYQRAYINDREMQLNTKATGQFEDYYQSIREGITIPGNGKTSDGCGCK